MIDLLSATRAVLTESGFVTRLATVERLPILRFEDEALLGFACVFDSPDDLLQRWKPTELSLLKHYSATLRVAGDKAWNVYCVFLCRSAADPEESRQVRWVEEDLERTRKVTSCGLASREDLVRALLPLLSLQQQPVLGAEDVRERLQRRILAIAPKVADVALDEAVPIAEVVRLLGEQA